MKLPPIITDFVQRRGQGAEHRDPCESCNAHCCTQPGFALLENVLEIYRKHEAGELVREDYGFEEGLSLRQFIWRYFDRGLQEHRLLTFIPKTFTSDFGIISVPPDNYYRMRAQIHKVTDSRGCVFLSRRLEEPGSKPNFCILHSAAVEQEVTAKPIDCVFLRCTAPREIIKPSLEESAEWIAMLDARFPDSVKRFLELCPGMPDQKAGIYRTFADRRKGGFVTDAR